MRCAPGNAYTPGLGHLVFDEIRYPYDCVLAYVVDYLCFIDQDGFV